MIFCILSKSGACFLCNMQVRKLQILLDLSEKICYNRIGKERFRMKYNYFLCRMTAFIIAAAMGCFSLTACSSKQDKNNSSSQITVIDDDEPTTQKRLSETTPKETEPPVTEHISPAESITYQSGTQKSFSDVILNHETNKNYSMSLADFILPGDSVQSIIFEFEASGDIGSYQGGCGISVTEDCKAANNPYWYQSPDFTASADGHYVKIVWDVPEDIQNYVNANGTFQIGYWWGDTEEVELKYVTCNYTRNKQIPVDKTVELSVKETLNYNDNPSESISLADVLNDECTLQAVIFTLHADSALGKFNGGFGVRTKKDWYQSETVSQFTEENALTLTWLIPEGIQNDIPSDTEISFDYFWSECEEITLDSVQVKFSYGLDPNNLPEGLEVQVVHQNDDARKIAESITVGWNLGNSLDCYNVDWTVTDFETAWGNPKTTKHMIAAVKAAGFNAVRIPVSWTDHIDDKGNIDSIWLTRVQQVVDYAMDNKLYTILNMHHDDYTWLNPTYEDEEEVTEKYIHIWSQIAKRFQDYDTKLLFEGLNEPRVIGSPNEWTGGTDEERDVINHLLQAFVDTVRSSGGNNPLRTLVITTHAASIDSQAIKGLVMPDDDNLILSIHNYAPWKFTSSEFPSEDTFSEKEKAELKEEFLFLYNTFVSKGVPVIIGEFGAENKNNTADRAAYYEYYIKSARDRGIPCFVWDNNVSEGNGSYGLLNREDNTWYFPEILEGIQNAVK